jgi:hypothetical protein
MKTIKGTISKSTAINQDRNPYNTKKSPWYKPYTLLD